MNTQILVIDIEGMTFRGCTYLAAVLLLRPDWGRRQSAARERSSPAAGGHAT